MKKTKTDRKVRRGLFSASHSNGRKFFFACNPENVSLVGVARIDESNEESEDLANARLIAAAPDLLEALRYLDDAINEPSLEIDLVAASNRARAALAKAEDRA